MESDDEGSARGDVDERPATHGQGGSAAGRNRRGGGGKAGPKAGAGSQRQAGGKSRQGGRGARSGDARTQQQTPLEIAVRSARNAQRRHAESLRDEQTRLACRGVMTAIAGGGSGASNPAELLAEVEHALHVLEAGEREASRLPATMRAVATFALADRRRLREVIEMLRLTLRSGYVLAADHIPRQARDDGPFRASALRTAMTETAQLYLDDAAFERAARS